jgi:hypothetical protein
MINSVRSRSTGIAHVVFLGLQEKPIITNLQICDCVNPPLTDNPHSDQVEANIREENWNPFHLATAKDHWQS